MLVCCVTQAGVLNVYLYKVIIGFNATLFLLSFIFSPLGKIIIVKLRHLDTGYLGYGPEIVHQHRVIDCTRCTSRCTEVTTDPH